MATGSQAPQRTPKSSVSDFSGKHRDSRPGKHTHSYWKWSIYSIYSGFFHEKYGDFLVKQFAIEAMAIEIVDLPIESMVIFHSFLKTFTRGYTKTKLGYEDCFHHYFLAIHCIKSAFTQQYKGINPNLGHLNCNWNWENDDKWRFRFWDKTVYWMQFPTSKIEQTRADLLYG